ncbi:TIGR03751 family conjugal transfer lipoprotein [Pseudomonas mosselii]|uniref:TIGR03751 family conjugal transfer lipoprotein n=1 Tax=Pseudomonas mosselii TaxID=78327 RepID=UPI0027DCE996|nr:TIGR03751 family conjugal transfer lipoprotein [Pseudomonas mosselii]
MSRRSTNFLVLAVMLATGMTGCTTNSEKLLTHGGRSIDQVWRQETGGDPSQRLLLDARQALRRPLDEPGSNGSASSYSRTAQNEINRLFHRLPNPDLVMYVFPHLAGSDPVPVPGYSTVFPLYQRVQYALPGERAEDY